MLRSECRASNSAPLERQRDEDRTHWLLAAFQDAAAYRLRTEPREGFMSTCEGVARALGILEGCHVRDAILRPLGRLVEMQAEFSPAVRARMGGGEYVPHVLRRTPGIGKA